MSLNKENLIIEFAKYVDNFDFSEDGINRKYYHSIRVMEFAEKIAISENFDEDDIEIAIILGLLHDYARFEQWTNYHTFSDIKSIDHGDLAVDILFNQNHIEKFYNKKENYKIIINAIKYHNKFSIPDGLDEKTEKMCKLIRDADKLDIMDIFCNGILEFDYDEAEISEDIKQDFFNHKSINRKNVKSGNDKNLLELAMFYDYNFDFSYKYTIENNILDKLFDKVQNKEMFKEYFNYMKNFLYEKINSNK